jgi:2-phospho-L-lactate/phosphoenolpyruvate guanylyltransferase
VLVPIKRLEAAKTRLRGGLTDADHEALVLAMALDTVAAALASPVVGRVVVVTADPVPGDAAVVLGAELIADVPDAGLNPALAYAAALVRRTGTTPSQPGVAALTADLPALRTDELTDALRRAEQTAAARGSRGHRGGRSFVADASGAGTVLLAAPPAALLEPCFGIGSAAAHLASGAVPLTEPWPSLRRDVDTPAELAEAFVLGVGARTAVAAQAVQRAHLTADPLGG